MSAEDGGGLHGAVTCGKARPALVNLHNRRGSLVASTSNLHFSLHMHALSKHSTSTSSFFLFASQSLVPQTLYVISLCSSEGHIRARHLTRPTMEVNPSDYPITIPYKSTSPQDPEAGILREEFSAFERESQCINLQDECWAFDEGVVGTDKSPEVSLDFTHRVCQFVAVGDCQGTLEAVTVYSGWLVNGHYNYRESIFIAHHTGYAPPPHLFCL